MEVKECRNCEEDVIRAYGRYWHLLPDDGGEFLCLSITCSPEKECACENPQPERKRR